MSKEEDKTIIRLVLSGKQSAFSVLVERYQCFVFTLIRRRVKDREQAEELAQDVFLKAYRFLHTFRGNSKFSTWLYTIVHTTCASYTRTVKQAPSLPGSEQVIYYSDRGQEKNTHIDPLDLRSQKSDLETALEKLDPDDKEIVTLFYQGGLKIEEISEVMKMSVSNIKIRLFRSRQRLRKLLANTIKEYR